MPAGFENCEEKGGRIRTVKGKRYGCSENQYRHICFLDGKAYLGEIHTKKKQGKTVLTRG